MTKVRDQNSLDSLYFEPGPFYLVTDDLGGFYSRAKDAARRANQGQGFEGIVTITFEDPQRMFAVLSQEPSADA